MKKNIVTIGLLIFSFLLGITNNIFASEEKTIDKFVDNIEVISIDGGAIGADSGLEVIYNWSIKQHKKGDVISILIPKELKIGKNINFDLKTQNNEILGKVRVNTNNEININLEDKNDYISKHRNIHGKLIVNACFNMDEAKSKGAINLKFLENNKYNIFSNIKMEKDYNSIVNSKYLYQWGELRDNKHIHWAIKFNCEREKLQNLCLKNQLGIGQVIDYDSMQLNKVTLNPNYKIIHSENSNNLINLNYQDDNVFDVDIESVEGTYILEFDSIITDESINKFTNNVTMKNDNLDDINNLKEISCTGSGEVIGEEIASYKPPIDPNLPKDDNLSKEIKNNKQTNYKSNNNINMKNNSNYTNNHHNQNKALTHNYAFNLNNKKIINNDNYPKKEEVNNVINKPISYNVDTINNENNVNEVSNKQTSKNLKNKIQRKSYFNAYLFKTISFDKMAVTPIISTIMMLAVGSLAVVLFKKD